MDQNENDGATPKNPARTKEATNAITEITSGLFKTDLILSNTALSFFENQTPKQKNKRARATDERKITYFPTINGKSVEVETIATPKSGINKKNFDILK